MDDEYREPAVGKASDIHDSAGRNAVGLVMVVVGAVSWLLLKTIGSPFPFPIAALTGVAAGYLFGVRIGYFEFR